MTIRTVNLLCLGASLLCAAPLAERTRVMMGTFASIKLQPSDLPKADAAFLRLQAVEKALSGYDPEAEIFRLNRDRNVSISADTFEALTLSRRYSQESGGYFDISVGSITRDLYRFGEEERLPAIRELEAAAIGMSGVHFSYDRAWLDGHITVDLGGMGKGFGVDKATETLRAAGVTRGIVALSGDIRCLDRCDFTIQDPFDSSRQIAALTTRHPNTAISTSGNYRRYVRTPAANHLIDPKRKRPQQTFASITLLSTLPSSDLDAYATAASVMPPEAALRFLEELDAGYIIVFTDKTLRSGGELNEYAVSVRWLDTAQSDTDQQNQK